MQRLVECPVCLNYYDTKTRVPKTLFCGHGFCLPCVRDLISNSRITCPKCRQECLLSQATVEQLPTTYATLELLSTTCEECRDQSWTQHCGHCSRNLCDKCLGSHLPGSSADLVTELRALQEVIRAMQLESNDDSPLKHITAQGEKAIAVITRTFDECIDDLRHRNKKLVSMVKDQMDRDSEIFLKWRENINKVLKDMDSFVEDALAQLSGATSQVDVLQQRCKERMSTLRAARKTKPYSASITFYPTRQNFEVLASKCGDIEISSSNKSFPVKTSSETNGEKNLPSTSSDPGPFTYEAGSSAASSKSFTGCVPDYRRAKYRTGHKQSADSSNMLPWFWGIAVSPVTSDFIVTSYMSNIIQVYSSDLKPKAKVTQAVDKQGTFPFGVSVSSQNRIYITSQTDHCINITDDLGNQLKKISSLGNGPQDLDTPHDLTFDKDSLLYVCDGGNRRIQIFQQNGTYVKSIADGIFIHAPFFISVSQVDGRLAVSDYKGNLYILSNSGKLLKMIPANQPPLSLDATGVDFDNYGNIIVADQGGRLLALQCDGEYICTVGEGTGSDLQLTDPRGVVVNRKGDIAVCDIAHGIQLFEVPQNLNTN